ncbi:DEAD/DEAH box helicase [Microbacterium sp. SLBN-111]|uniref:DEAD/DEAH box helicase n=1 Tax=Microbacterium sp. SLBN-111 TaxID=3377733 RepID=UPI003C773622
MDIDPELWQHVSEIFPPAVIARARWIVASGSVDVGETEFGSDAIVASAECFGSAGYEHLEVRVSPDISALSAWCSCDQGPACSHVCAATVVLLTRLMGDHEASRPEWQRTLDDFFGSPLDVDMSEEELCLFLSVRRPSGYVRGNALTIVARPGMRGARGKWIKGRATWTSLSSLPARPDAQAAVDSLGRLGRSSFRGYAGDEWMPLSDVPPHSLWTHLEALSAAGVPMVSGASAHREVKVWETPVSGSVEIERRGAEVHLRGTLSSIPETLSRLPFWVVGDPAVAVVFVDGLDGDDEAITLARIDPPAVGPLRGLLERREPLVIAAEAEDAFRGQYLPRLQSAAPVISPGSSFDLPAPPMPVLELAVEFDDEGANVAWWWDRSLSRGRSHAAYEAGIAVRVAEVLDDVHFVLPVPESWGASEAMRLSPASAAVLAAEVLPLLRDLHGVRVRTEGDGPGLRPADDVPTVELSTGADDGSDWFDLRARVRVGEEEVDFTTLYTALALGDRVLFLTDGRYARLDGPEFDRLREIIDEARALTDATGDSVKVNRYDLALWDDLAELGMITAHEADWWLRVQGLASGAAVEPVPPPVGLRAALREYQLAGLAWLHFLRVNGLGGILADDMGLGKTVQTIAMMETAREADPTMAPFLIVAPTSVVGNWARECATFAPGLVVVSVGATETRRGATLAQAVAGAHVVVTSYALFRLEQEQYADLEWSGLVLDEAQQIKNPASRGYRAARALSVPFKLVITGTPMENNLSELWALVSLVAPGLLGTRESFQKMYRNRIEKHSDADRLAQLRRRIRPFLLRRSKELVASELPPKQEIVIDIELHPAHRRLYDRRFHRERQRLLGLLDDVASNRFEIFRSLTMLRQLALDPTLIGEAEAPSAKLDALETLLVEAAAEGHRILVLSQFTRFLKAARQRCEEAGVASGYLDGSTTNRQAEIDRFREGTDPAFFVSLKAGGVGLNLVEADYVVLLDPWWNPAVEEQAIDRAHRIGQTRPVIVYRLVAAGTVEEKVVALRESKSALFAQVLDGDGGEGSFSGGSAFSADDLRRLLE